MTERAGSTRVLSKAGKENLLSSVIRVLVTMRAICFMPTTSDSCKYRLAPLSRHGFGEHLRGRQCRRIPTLHLLGSIHCGPERDIDLQHRRRGGSVCPDLDGRSGKELGRIGDPGVMANPTLSPDGSRVAVDISDQKANNVDIWIESTTGAANSRFTFDPSEEVVGVWSRDGSMLAYRIAAADGTALYIKPTTGLEREKKRFTTPKVGLGRHRPRAIIPDDRPKRSDAYTESAGCPGTRSWPESHPWPTSE